MHQTGFNSVKNKILSGLLLIILASVMTASYAAADKTPVVVTIRPLYSLVTQLLDGIEKPVLLMKQTQSPHHYNLRPSERRLLSDARAIIWIGPQMESHLTKIIQQQKESKLTISAMRAEGLKLLDKRSKHNHANSHHDNDHDSHTGSATHFTVDPHIWLSTQNAIAISRHITNKFIASDPANTALYQKNLQRLTDRINETRDFIRATLQDSSQPYIAYHDAFQYFDDEFELNFIDAISHDEETGTSLKQLNRISSEINNHNIQCLVYQAPEPAIVNTLARRTRMKAVALDPLGLNVKNDNEVWFELMQQLAVNFQRCLAP